MKFKVLTYNNGVGIVTDGELITKVIKDHITENVTLSFVNEFVIDKFDVGIWIQNFDINLLNCFKTNVFFINEEWAGDHELNNLHLFDYVVCKNSYAKELLKSHTNVVCLPFISKNMWCNTNSKNSYLHFAGRSIQKNTELILKQNIPITLIDPYNLHNPPNNVIHINNYQSENELKIILNSHNIHICCSLYESWGHYLFEGLSTGAEIICSDIPVFKEQLDPNLVHFVPTTENRDKNYIFDSEDRFPLRKSFHTDKKFLANLIENFKPIEKSEERIKMFQDIMEKNKNNIILFLKSIY